VLKRDTGRTTGPIDRVEGYRDNQGPLILDNRMERNGLNGMLVRGQTLTTESVWDDTDIVHVVLDTIYVPDFHTYGGLTLASSPTESLVVKLLNGPTQAGFVATGIRHEIDDRIGGIIQIVGQPGSPVVLTSLYDDSHGAGSRPDGDPQVDTNSDEDRSSPQPGDWNSVRLDRFSHDRNVELYYEFEARDVNSPGPNGTPDEAQLLGALAPSEYGGDENRRLGFTVKGFLNDPQDIDVYSFEGIPGTEVWIDVDRSTHAFDPVVELLDAQGTVVARSNDSTDELKNPNNFLEPFERVAPTLSPRELNDANLLVGEARPMMKTPQIPVKDFYTTNPRNPGMRLLLPGIPDPNNPDRPLTYHVRVRSASGDLSILSGGLTSGAYELQIRLREMQEIGGSTVRYALIGYATNGVEVFGQPIHSPLAGESTENIVGNETFGASQGLGNLLESDRGAISVSGELDPWEDGNPLIPDVDFYEFEVDYLDPDPDILGPGSYETVFDIDYANGLGNRPNASVYLFNSAGRLILTSRDGNIAEDRPGTPGSSDLDDLSRGSVGATDPYIGIVDLGIGTYSVAVTADVRMPTELDQFFRSNATNPDVRLEPINTVRRIAEDHIDFGNNSTADPPQINVLFDGNSEVPYNLSDVVLYLSRHGGIPNDPTSTTVLTYDPFTGAHETNIFPNGATGSFGDETADIAMHENGLLYAYRLSENEPVPCDQPETHRDSNSGNFLRIDPGDGSATRIIDDGIATYHMDTPGTSIESNYCAITDSRIGDGIEFNALTMFNTQTGFAVGDRGFNNWTNLIPGVEVVDNILYRIVTDQTSPSFGQGTSIPYQDKADDVNNPPGAIYLGAGTQIRERGEMLTSPRMEAVYATTADPGNIPLSSTSLIDDGEYFTVIDGANRVTFEFDTGPEIAQDINLSVDRTIRDGNFFQLDDNIFQFDTGASVVFDLNRGSGANIVGAVIYVNDGANTVGFEFIPDPPPQGYVQRDPQATPIRASRLNGLGSAGDLAAAINADGTLNVVAHAPGPRVSIEGDFMVTVTPRGYENFLWIEGDDGAAPILQGVDGSLIDDGDNFFISNAGFLQEFEFDSGYTVHIPVRYMLQLPASGGRGIQDGEFFTLNHVANAVNLTFEFDRGGITMVDPLDSNHIFIGYQPVDTADAIAAEIVRILDPATATLDDGTGAQVPNPAIGLDLAPINLGSGLAHLGSTADNVLDASNAPSLAQIGQAAAIGDGELFTITDGLGTAVTFEFDDAEDGNLDVIDVNVDGIPDNPIITFAQIDTHDDIADRIVTQVGGAGLQLTPMNLGDGNVNIGGDDGRPLGNPNHTLDTTTAPSITQSGAPGVAAPGLGNAGPVPIPFLPWEGFTALDVATSMQAAMTRASNTIQVIQAMAGNQYVDDSPIIQIDNDGVLYDVVPNYVGTPPRVAPPGTQQVVFTVDPGNPAANPVVPPTAATTVAARIGAAINSIPNNVLTVTVTGSTVTVQQYPIQLRTQLVNDRLVVNGLNVFYVPDTSRILDLTNSTLGFTIIGGVEESYTPPNPAAPAPSETFVPPRPGGRNLTDHYIATRVKAVVGTHPDYRASGVGGAFSRINFPDAQVVDFAGVPVWNQVMTSGFGVASGNERIVLWADDQPTDHFVDGDLDGVADDVNGNGAAGQTGVTPAGDQLPGLARKITDAIDTAMNVPFGIDATELGRFVRLNRGAIDNQSAIITAGEGPGGRITGLATLGTTLWAVSDTGGLFRIDNPIPPNSIFFVPATADYIESSEDDLLGIQFSGLTAGPQNVEGGRYANMLFATDIDGNIYAFDTNGEAQPVFVDGQKSVSTGWHPNEVRGIAFSTLDENLFHVTPFNPDPFPGWFQAADPMDQRLGLPSSFYVYYRQHDAGHERYNSVGGTQSIHFGKGLAVDGAGTPLGPRTYDFPGGAQGSMVSNEFSLKGYSAADRPTLYFSYWLDTENVNGTLFGLPMRDALRVFVADNDGDWQLLTTNNNNELGVGPFDVQETYDEAPTDEDWRQVRVPLDAYAGRENLRLRVDFSTSADFDLGDPGTTGDEIRAVAGVYINDGDTTVIDNLTIEWDSGLTIVAPTGQAIQTGEQITVTDQLDNTAILEFVDNVLTRSHIIATDGSVLNDADRFQIDDESTTATFEFDTGYIIEVPANGGAGIGDLETFAVDLDGPIVDGFGNEIIPPEVFEFDRDGNHIDVADPLGVDDNTIINIADNLTIVVPGAGGAVIGPQDTFSLGDGTTTFTFEFDNDGMVIPGRHAVNFRSNWSILLPPSGGGFGGVSDGDAFTIDPDGAAGIVPPLVFEFDDDGVSGGDETIRFDHFTTQDVLADSVVIAVNNQFAILGLTAKNTGGGRVVLDGTTVSHILDTSPAGTVGQVQVPLTQEELAERIITAMDNADGADGTVLGLSLPSVAAGEVVNGRIVLGGTWPNHVLNTGGSAALTQATTPRTAEEIADRISNAINAEFASTTVRATSLPGGLVSVLRVNLVPPLGEDHTVDTINAPGLTLRGTPGVTPGNIAISFLPTDTVDEIINGASPVIAGAQPRPGLIAAINGSGLNVLATQSAFPNENVVTLAGTVGNQVTFSPGVTALEPEGVIPIYVDETQTANDVAERIALGIQQAVARGDLVAVTPHLNGDLGYENPSVPPGEVRINSVNLEGATNVVVDANSLLTVDGGVDVNVGNLAAPIHTDMDRVEVASVLDGLLEDYYHNPTIIADDGLQFSDGDTFVLDDGLNAPVTYEFDHGYVLNIPIGGGVVANGGIPDGEYFTITDLSGTISATFEYDKDGSVMPGSTPIQIRENDSALGVAKLTVQELQNHPLRTTLGLTPRFLTGNRVRIGGSLGSTLTLIPGGVLTQSPGEPGVQPAVTIQLPQTLGIQLPEPLTIHIPAGGIADGETFVIGDGVLPPATFEFENTAFGDGVALGNVQVNFSPASNEEEIGREIVTAIASSGLIVQATMIGGIGNIDLGGGANFVLTLPQGSPLMQTGPLSLQAPVAGGSAITDGDYFTINDGPATLTFEFEDTSLPPGDPGIGVTPGNIQIDYDPNDSQEAIADHIILRLQSTPGLDLDPVKTTGPGLVHLGSVAHDGSPFTNVTLDTTLTHLTQTGQHDQIVDGQLFVISDGTQTVQFEFDVDGTVNPANAIVDVAPGSTPHQIASEIIHEIGDATLGLFPEHEGNGRIHIGGTALHQLDTSAIASITQFGQPAPIPDQLTFIISEAAGSRTFEFTKDLTPEPGNIGIIFDDSDSTDAIAQRTVTAIASGVSGLNIFPTYLGNGVIDVGGNQNHVVTLTSNLTQLGPMALQVPAAGGGITGVVDGEVFTITDLATTIDYVFEFDNDIPSIEGVTYQTGNIPIPFAFANSQNDIGHAIVQAVRDVAALDFSPTYDVGGVVNLGGDPLTHSLSLNSTVLTATGLRGGQTPHVAVDFSPSDDFTAKNVADAIAVSVNNTLALNITASAGAAGTADQRRIELTHTTGFPTDITFTPDAGGILSLEAPNDVVKQDEDLVRIIGHNVVDPGPLGLDAALDADAYGVFDHPRFGNSEAYRRGEQNQFEGIYLDDFLIGFAERGEAVANANNGSTGFTGNPDGSGRSSGEYQLEIRRGPEPEAPLVSAGGARIFDTNDRMADGTTIVVQRGLDIADGQTFTISDGVEHVVFEYVDTSIPNNLAEQGRIPVPFVPADEDYVIAQRVRDAINSNDAQAVLDVTASMSDGTLLGSGSPTPSTSPRVNLFGPVTLEVHATDVEETNDTIAEATPTGIVGVDSPSFLGAGYIGDNPNFPLHTGMDVDMFQVALSAGETLRVDVDANEIGSVLDPVLRVFDSSGTPFLFDGSGRNVPIGTDYVDDVAAPAEFFRLDPFIEFTPTSSGSYYVAVSGYDNWTYDATEEGSGREGNTGFYQIEITFGASTGNDFVLFDEKGDPNLFRDQGQVLIQANTIKDSSGYGIVADAGLRDGQDGDVPHQGPVRNTPKLNTDNLVPGVVIANNVIAHNQTGGILFSGDDNSAVAGGQAASVPFGRIINNTISGSGTAAITQLSSLIDFETLPGGTPAEGTPIDTQFQATHGVTFIYEDGTFPILAQVGAPETAFFQDDTVDPAIASQVGQFFLTDPDGTIAGPTSSLLVQYSPPTGSASGAILDIDGASTGGALAGDEQWTIEAIDASGAVLQTVVLTAGDPGTGDGTASAWSIDVGVAAISQIRFSSTGDAPASASGFAMDNFFARGEEAVGTGIVVEENASPTVLNNILAGLETGISIDGTSQTTVVGGSVYKGNDTPTLGVVNQDFPLYLTDGDPLFRDAAHDNFYLAPFSQAVDSSVGSLLDRFDIEQVKNQIGISDSPILAPDTDVTGQLRVDDPEVETPAGFGENVFIDRGAVDRSDFVGPTATTVKPRDNDADGLDQNAEPTAIELADGTILSSFRFRLLDGVPPADPNLGSGIDDTTVVSSNVDIRRDGVQLVDGIDYSYSYNATSDTIVLTPISGIWKADSTYTVTVNNTDHFQLVPKPGSELNDGDSFLVQAGSAATPDTYEFESGYTLLIPPTLALQVPEAGGSLGGIADGSTFTIQRTLGGGTVQTEVFEFDSNGVWIDNNGDLIPDNHVVSYNVASSPEEIAEAIVGQILMANLGLSPQHIGEGLVHLGSTSEYSVDVRRSPNLTVTGQASGVEDGDNFTIDDGSKIVTFEFDNDDQLADVDGDGQPDNPDAWVIHFRASETHEEIAASVITEIGLADLGLEPTAVGGGIIHLGGTPNVHQINLSQSNLVLIGTPGVRPAWGLQIPTKAGMPRTEDDGSGLPFLTDGDTFTITDGTSSITFEFDDLDDPIGGGFSTAPNTVVAYRSGSSTPDQIAAVLVAAIQSAPLAGLTPVNAGNGIVLLGEPTNGAAIHSVDVSQTGLGEVGNPGVPAAIPVPFTPHETFDGGQVAVSLIEAINGNDPTVLAQPGGGDLVIVEGATAVSEIHPVFVSNAFFGGVKDLAGNDLKPNLLSGETQVTVVLGEGNMDFGDAPQTPGGDYPTQLGQNGAIHVITGTGLFLGERVDADGDGQISLAVDGDDLDSEGFVVDLPDPNPIPPTKPGPVNVSLRDSLGNLVRNDITPTTILLPQPLALVVGDGTVMRDGDQFRPGNDGIAVTFEFDDGTGILSDPNNVAVTFDGSETVDEIADRVATFVNSRPELGLTPVNLGAGVVHLGGDSLSVLALGTGLASAGIANPIQDEEWFTIDVDPGVGTDIYTFEFEDADEDDGVGAGNIPILFDITTTQEGYARALIDSILGTRLGIAATYLGNGEVELNGDDDDGVLMGAFNPLTETEIIVTASAAGLLDAWIDFNIDGDFNDPGEQIFASQQLTEGENTFAVQPPPPPGTKTGTTVGRFRFSSTGGLLPTGLAADGEVEDYEVNILEGNPPVANPDFVAFSEDETGLNTAPSVLDNDTDADFGDTDILTVASYQSMSELGATVVMDTTSIPATKGTFQYFPLGSDILQGLDSGETMTDTFTYRAKDAMFLSSPGTVTITVMGENDAPTATDDVQVFTDQRTPIDVDVLANDTDPENHPLTIILGTAVGEAGDAYVYEVQTVTLGGTAGTVTLFYNGVPGDTPLAYDPGATPTSADVQAHLDSIPQLAGSTNVVGADGGPFAVEFHGAFRDVNALALTTSTTDGATAAVATVGNRLRYDPNGQFDGLDQGETGTDSFTYTIDDGNGEIDTGTVTVTISGLNDPPVAVDDEAPEAATDEETPKIVRVLLNDHDPEDDPGIRTISVTAVQTIVTRGLVNVNSPGTADNDVTYDPDGQFESLAVGQTGTDVFEYLVQDRDGNTSMGTVTMTISGVNDDPVAVSDGNIQVPRNGTVDINVLANDTDIDVGDAANLTVLPPLDLSQTQGIASINADGTIKYDPNGMFDHLLIGQSAQDRFAYTASDGHGGTSTATVTVTVFGASNPPVATDDGVTPLVTTTEDDSVTIDVLFNDFDDFGPKIVTAVDQTGLQGSVVINPIDTPNNVVIYSPDGQFDTLAANEQTTETFTYTVSDGVGSDTANVTVTITGVNDAPIANIDANGYVAERGRTLSAGDRDGLATPGVPGDDGVLLNDTDAEDDALRAVLIAAPQHAAANGFTLNADGTFTYTHNGGPASTDTFQYVAVDAHNAQSDQTVTVVIRIEDAPAAEWQNPINRFDVNNDGFVSPIDALLVINYINANIPNLTLPSPRPIGAPFYDVNGDGDATSLDVLQIILEINSQNSLGEGEYYPPAEGEGGPASPTIIPPLANVSLALPDQDSPVVSAEPSYVQPDPVEESDHSREPAIGYRSTQVERAPGRANKDETVSIDPFGVEDVLSTIAEDVNDSLAGRTPLDDVLEEILG